MNSLIDLLKFILRPLTPKPIRSFLRKKFVKEQTPEQAEAEKDEQKIRTRTEEELQKQAEGLRQVRDIFDTLEIPYYVSGGTLLGIVREGDFIKWDWDVGIDAKIEDIYPKKDMLMELLQKQGFEIITHYPEKTNFKINAEKYGAKYEIAGFIKVGENRVRKSYNYPDSFMSGHSEVVLRGETYKTFPFPEKYLEWIYGDWKTPVKTIDKGAYVTSSSRTSRWDLFWAHVLGIFK